MDKDVKGTFTPQSKVSFRSALKLNSYLVKASLHSLERMVGLYKCKSKQCRIFNNIMDADSFTCSNDQTNFKINHKFRCK